MFNKISLLSIILIIFFIIICCNNTSNNNETTTTTQLSTTTTTLLYPETITQKGRLTTLINFPSNYLNNNRAIRIYLPKSYDPSDDSKRYKVIYMHDGQNVFAPGGSFGCWYTEVAYDNLVTKNLIEEAIIIGINNTNDRISEYTPSYDEKYKGGNGASYTNFIIKELMPYINKFYKTKIGPENTAIIGSSLGGLISFYISWNNPDIFGMAGCVSSSFWWDERELLKSIENYSGPKKNIKYWIDSGTAEGSDTTTDLQDNANDGRTYMIEDARRMANKLLKLGWEQGINLAYREGAGDAHNELAWSKRIYDILFFFLKKQEPVLQSIKCRPFIEELELSGKFNKTFVSVDLIYDNILVTLLTYNKNILSTSDNNIATIDNNLDGKITIKSVGQVKIIANYDTFTDEKLIKISN